MKYFNHSMCTSCTSFQIQETLPMHISIWLDSLLVPITFCYSRKPVYDTSTNYVRGTLVSVTVWIQSPLDHQRPERYKFPISCFGSCPHAQGPLSVVYGTVLS